MQNQLRHLLFEIITMVSKIILLQIVMFQEYLFDWIGEMERVIHFYVSVEYFFEFRKSMKVVVFQIFLKDLDYRGDFLGK